MLFPFTILLDILFYSWVWDLFAFVTEELWVVCLVDKVVISERLDSMILEVFSKLKDSVIL